MQLKNWFLLGIIVCLGMGYDCSRKPSIDMLFLKPNTQSPVCLRESQSYEPISLPAIESLDQGLERNSTRIYSNKNINSLEKFKTFLDWMRQELPTLEQFNIEDNIYHAPEILFQAGFRLSEVAEILQHHPEFQLEAQVFYQDCYQNDQLPAALRALCFDDYREFYRKDSSVPEPWREQERLPRSVQQLLETRHEVL